MNVADTKPNRVSPQTLQRPVYDEGKVHFLPQMFGIGGEITDFWSTIFPNAARRQTEYERLVQTEIAQSGLVSKTEQVSFRHGVILGKVRPFFTIQRGSVIGTVYIGKLGQDLNDIYVSLRVLFIGKVSRAKSMVCWLLLSFAAAFPSLVFFIPVWVGMGFMKSTYDCSYGNCYVTGQEIDKTGGVIAYLVTLVVMTGIFSIVFELWSWWRYGDAKALVREDLDELYRDDLSALGQELYNALNISADALDFARLSETPQSPPNFGATTQTSQTRKRRI